MQVVPGDHFLREGCAYIFSPSRNFSDGRNRGAIVNSLSNMIGQCNNSVVRFPNQSLSQRLPQPVCTKSKPVALFNFRIIICLSCRGEIPTDERNGSLQR